MNIHYLNTLQIDKVIEFYDIPLSYTIRDNMNNIYLCTLLEYICNNVYIIKIKNISNYYETVELVVECDNCLGKYVRIK